MVVTDLFGHFYNGMQIDFLEQISQLDIIVIVIRESFV